MFVNLKAEMVKKGISQEQLAIVADVSLRTVSSWLNDSSPGILLSKAIAIRDSLFKGMDIEVLFENS